MASDNAISPSSALIASGAMSEPGPISMSTTTTTAAVRTDMGSAALPPLYESPSAVNASTVVVARAGSSGVGVEPERGEMGTTKTNLVPLVFRPRLKRLSILPKKRK
ncbi:6264_t:CDS:1, partial [Acaulospora colombiana]